MNALSKLNFQIIPVQIFLFIFWFKNGVVDKFFSILMGFVSPGSVPHGDTYEGWAEYIVGTWDKSEIGHALLSPMFPFMFPVLIGLQIMPVLFILRSVLNQEFLTGHIDLTFTRLAAIASLCVTSVMLVSQTITGADDGQYLWQLLGLGMVTLMYINMLNKEAK
ncbi:hypothetical protein [Vibrio splendidus]|uniref:hypothetical protein n=1 Tax=Vibrio splendidus TaxID=29497 RepID=UPI002468AA03|nr:hypothetical protein [Vibrio splendidus]MDH6018513.1 hypothetical protein [Vibrio splendidus]